MDDEGDWAKASVPIRVDVQHQGNWIQVPLIASVYEWEDEHEIFQNLAASLVAEAKGPETMVPMVRQQITEQLAEGRAFVATLPDRLAAPVRLEPLQCAFFHL